MPGAENEVPLAKLPKPVRDAADRALPNATWHVAVKVEEDGKTAYELDGTDQRQRDATVLVTAAGKVVEVETKLKVVTNVPEKALAAVRDKWPRFEPTETHLIRQGEDLRGPRDGDHLYDLRGTVSKERALEVQVTADGKLLESTVEVFLNKVPAVVTAALKAKRPKFEVGTAYALREGEEIIGYHFEGKGPAGRDRTISVTPDGKRVELVE